MAETIAYRSNIKITVDDFIDLLKRSTLDERRPVDEPERIRKMIDHGNVMVTAWDAEKLVGVSRALTDFSFCCYLSDLAVDKEYQHKGIGKALVRLTQEAAGPDATVILLAAPKATKYYPRIGLTPFEHCFILKKKNKEA